MPQDQPLSKTNSAKRLHAALVAMKAVPGVYQVKNQNQSRSGLDALPMALDLPLDERISSRGWELMRAIKIVTEMINDTRLEVERSEFESADKEFYLRDLPRLTEVLSPHTLGQNWNDITARLSPDLLVHLENIDRVLTRRTAEKSLGNDDFAPLLQGLSDALIALDEMELEGSAKSFIKTQLLNIRLAVDEYKFRGITGLQPAIAGYLGSLGLAKDQLAEASHAPEGKSKMDKLVEVVKAGGQLLNTAHGAAWVWPHLTHGVEAVINFLPHGL